MSVPTPPSNLIRQPNRGFAFFHMREIYVPGGDGLYVPNVDDLIVDYTAGFYRCTAVDYTTGISTLQPWFPPNSSNVISDQDILLGAGPGTQSESYRAYLDTSVIPYTLALDARLHVYGTGNRYAKIFKGTDISAVTGQVISAMFDQSGNFIGDTLPLEQVAYDTLNNVAIKTPVVGYTREQFQDGEVLTVVIYDDAGNTRSLNKVLVKNTSFIRTVDLSTEYIVDITLDSPFLSASDPTTLEVPINMPVINIPMVGVVTYNSGRRVQMPIDGVKFAVLGLDNYIATRAGQTVPVALSYKLNQNEYSYVLNPSQNNHITKQFQVRTANPNLSYNVKLYAFPVWQGSLNGYGLIFKLYNLERSTYYDVTSKVVAGAIGRAYNPLEYGLLQKVSFAVNLNEVDSRFSSYQHVETFEITLMAPPDQVTNRTYWMIGYTPGQDPKFGVELEANATYNSPNNWKIDLTCGASDLTSWLEKVYYRTLPLTDVATETQAPVPTHFRLISGGHTIELPITQWGTIATMHEAPEAGQCVLLEFVKRMSNNDLQLGASAMPVKHL